MRRTEQEFKAEVLRRSENFRRERVRKRKKLLGAGLCACICFAVLGILAPMGGASSDNAAADMLTMDDMKMESAMMQQEESTANRFPQETYWEYCFEDATPAENEAAPMEPEVAEPAAGVPTVEPAAVTIVCGEEEITLDAADSAVIMDYLSTAEWIESAANCLCDYTLYVNGEIYHYHSDCGTIQDGNGRSLTLTDADKRVFNDIMARCPMRIE